jgi:osmotically-inducible protein OsmY
MNLKQWSFVSMLSLGLTTGAAGLLPQAALARDNAAPTILTPTDVSLAASIQATLDRDRELALANISVAAKDGAVTLAGSVRSEDDRTRAIHDANSVPGVVKVYDEITVVEPSDF